MDNLTDVNTIKKLLKLHGFSFSKGLGQNFIINPEVCPRIAEMGNACENYGIIEIGTGIGVLTAELAKRAKKVVAVEIDKRLMSILDETLKEFDNIKIINQDIMKTDINELIEKEFDGMKVSVCANLPYYITSPIIMYLLEGMASIDTITVMVQKEAAERLCASVGSRLAGAITVVVNYYGNVSYLFDVPRESFMPSPNVDSAVIKIDLHKDKKYDVSDEEFLFKVIHSGFSQRRKTLANALSSMMGISKDIVFKILTETGLSQNVRTEKLKMEELIILSEKLKTYFN